MFFDRYMKDINNGWEMTTRYRLEIIDSYDCDYQTNRAEKESKVSYDGTTIHTSSSSKMSDK